MKKRYQVFISSTFEDLEEERKIITKTLMDIDCIPAGMELFPAVDENQLKYIKKIIDDCDYYLMLIGGRYGSTSNDGISFTEKEYNYAVSKKIKVIALVHKNINDIPYDKSETDPKKRDRLENFIKKIKKGRIVNYWTNSSEIAKIVSTSMIATINNFPAKGWVRAGSENIDQLLSENKELKSQISELQKKLNTTNSDTNLNLENIAPLDSTFTFNGWYNINMNGHISTQPMKHTISWKQIFLLISPYITEHPTNNEMRNIIAITIMNQAGLTGNHPKIKDQEYITLKLQLRAHGLVQTKLPNEAQNKTEFWNLTEKGEKMMMENRIIRES